MNTVVTSREEILSTCRELVQQQDWSAVSIRSVAAACGVSVGSIYNYFSSKEELMADTVESVWCELFHRPEDAEVFQDIEACVTWLYQRMEYGSKKYPGFFTLHALGWLREGTSEWRGRMEKTWEHMRSGLCMVLRRDQRVRADAFDDVFTPEHLADVLFSLLLSALVRRDYDPTAVLELIRRLLH